ncbi:MAG: HD domain-containing protein [Cytophagaceae bacterium]|nr:HD domain-containing protein [Cytophagaceae bacterium]
MNSKAAEAYILDQLSRELPPSLHYHGLHHTLDVTEAAMRLAGAEGITDPAALCLLRTAAFYHDAGFLVTYQNHEVAGCQLTREMLPQFGYAPESVEVICALIMATQSPQTPTTLLEQILCDADLDYLGRDDFPSIAQALFEEWQDRQLIDTEENWNRIQVRFLENHHYWTRTARQWRHARKQEHLRQLREQLSLPPN